MEQGRRGAEENSTRSLRDPVQTNDCHRGAVELSKTRENLVELTKKFGYQSWFDLSLVPGAFRQGRRPLWRGSFPGNGKPKQTLEEAEIARLKKALKDTEMERDVAAPASLKRRGPPRSTTEKGFIARRPGPP